MRLQLGLAATTREINAKTDAMDRREELCTGDRLAEAYMLANEEYKLRLVVELLIHVCNWGARGEQRAHSRCCLEEQ
eukprot:CAMPEP_0119405788 /NCGR_PEP_ID=MMETSP1335-20130426/357_1 /TAXON_ID=259385 /ORGANISM="Chrysoculter rhomboideus, Strain RCC1486" /LENGTH=76 /DNA_ID=CAMNT_0007429831 /DNA_START=521 /DNA_END=751 /DNA_ORIENTATION=-